MAKYKLTKTGAVIRNADGAAIPASPDNSDWQQFQKWLAAGNTPDPADPDPPPSQEQLDVTDAKADADVIEVASMTKADINTLLLGVGDNQAKQALRKLFKVVRILARRL